MSAGMPARPLQNDGYAAAPALGLSTSLIIESEFATNFNA
jgi:hypothetical protein